MNKWAKALVILIVLFFLFVPLVIATKYIAITQLYDHFVATLSNLTGINQYLINACVVLLMVPLYFGIKMFFSINRERRLIGISLLAVFLIVYNLGLYQLTKDVQFSFSDGRTMKWYALTPEGVKFYDRPGVEPVYGIQLKPVTPEVIRHLKLIEKGEFNPVDPEKAIWFNPTTGDPQIWYYQSVGGNFEFFNKPGYHPLTGETLKPVNKQIHFEWLEKRKKGELRYSPKSNNSELTQIPMKGDGTALTAVLIKDIRQRSVANHRTGNLRVIEGLAVNQAAYPLARIRVRLVIHDAYDVMLMEKIVSCGNLLTDAELEALSETEIQRELSIPQGSDVSNERIAPNGKIPFMIVFNQDQTGPVKTTVIHAVAVQTP